MSFTLNLDIAATPEEVFAFIADFANTPKWYSAVQRVERRSGSGGLDTEYAVHRQLPTGAAVNNVVVTAYRDGQQITFTSVSGPTPFTYQYSVDSTPLGTRLELEGTISAAGLAGPARLLGPVAEWLFKRGMQDNLGTLKELLHH
jgi:uncharacterized protein YndB with AHSA1/START domain